MCKSPAAALLSTLNLNSSQRCTQRLTPLCLAVSPGIMQGPTYTQDQLITKNKRSKERQTNKKSLRRVVHAGGKTTG
eukprot:1158344-Pelagomonas_calceolata.AAC.2